MTELSNDEIKIMEEEIIPLISEMLDISATELEKDYRHELSKPNRWRLESLRHACFKYHVYVSTTDYTTVEEFRTRKNDEIGIESVFTIVEVDDVVEYYEEDHPYARTKEDLLRNYRRVKVEDRKGDTIWMKVMDSPELVQKGDEGRTVLFQWAGYHIATDELYFLRGQRLREVIQVRYHKGFQIVEVDYNLLH